MWLPIVLIFVSGLWYRNSHKVYSPPPAWKVVDFEIREHQTSKDLHSDRAESLFDRDAHHRAGHSHQSLHNNHDFHDYQSDMVAAKDRAFQQQQISYDEVQDKIQEFIQWDRPNTDHWPAWHDYDRADYDPNRWEAMDRYEHHE